MKNSKISTSNQRIQMLLDDLGISKTEFCQRTGITKSALSNYLNGDRQPRQDAISKIAETFNVEPSWLMGYDVPKTVLSDDRYYELMAEKRYRHETRELMGHIKKYAELFRAAEGCSQEEIDLVTETLKAFKKQRKKED